MDLSLLKTFLALANTKNFTKAARMVFRSQSAISLQLVKLENLLGKKLFIRNNRKVKLTVHGEELLIHAKKILRAEEELINHFAKTPISGDVRFGTPEDIATHYLPPILSRFVDSHPTIHLSVDCQFTLPLLKGLEENRYDLILVKQDPHNPHPRSARIRKERLVWASKSSSKFAPPLPLVLTPAPCIYRKRAIEALERRSIPWSTVYTSPSHAGLIAAVKAGLGICVIPENQMPKELEQVHNLPSPDETEIALILSTSASDAAESLAQYISEPSIWP